MFKNKLNWVLLLLGIVFSNFLKAESIVFYPLCPENDMLQSERLNNFHKLLSLAANSLNLTEVKFQISKEGEEVCKSEKRRALAALLGSDRFLEGRYNITGDSVSVEMRMVYTRFIDKFTATRKLDGNVHHMNALIMEMVSAAFVELKISPSQLQWTAVSEIINNENSLYKEAGTTNPDQKTDYFESGILSYKAEQYDQAREYFRLIEPNHANYGEAMYYFGKTLLYFDEFNPALKAFTKALNAGYKAKMMEDYIAQCILLNKPADWFDTEAKRKAWWLGMDKKDLDLVIALMNNLKINGKNYSVNYSFVDADILTLFKTSVLALKDIKLDGFQPLRNLTNVDVLILENTKLKSDIGITYFNKLKIIRTDVEIKTPMILELSKNHRINVIKTKS
jgi:tetratricopeptide (TPR) repeat protein